MRAVLKAAGQICFGAYCVLGAGAVLGLAVSAAIDTARGNIGSALAAGVFFAAGAGLRALAKRCGPHGR
jgi:hypothetical protein